MSHRVITSVKVDVDRARMKITCPFSPWGFYRTPARRVLVRSVLSTLAIIACSRAPVASLPSPGSAISDTTSAANTTNAPRDAVPVYQQMALIAGGLPFPFVGKVAYFASSTAESTLVLVSISIANQSLTFVREGDRYRAPYEVRLSLQRDSLELSRVEALEFVRVATFAETSRSDESVVFHRYLRVVPGRYRLVVSLKDATSSRSNGGQVELDVPRLQTSGLSSALPVYEALGRSTLDSFPSVVASPRSTVVFGRDSTVDLYVESYGSGDTVPLQITLRDGHGASMWSGTSSLSRRGSLFSGIVHVPLAGTTVGVSTVTIARRDGADSAVAPVLVSFGDNIAVGSFEDMLEYLRLFASNSRIRKLREAPPEQRRVLWAEFLRTTDPDPSTPRNEALLAHFTRIQQANVRFRDDFSPGWLSPRGMTFVSFGEPDQVQEFIDNRRMARGRQQIWDYRNRNLRLVFIDESTTGRWIFAPGSETRFVTENNRRLAE
jgi:GWxTD domain-containing protein